MLPSLKIAAATAALAAAVVVGLHRGQAQEPAWRSLFNGKDLTGWDTWLGRPYKSSTVEGVKKNEKGEYAEVVGLNKDPNKVYTVVDADGQPAVRISGEIFGAITSVEEFENYHFRVEFKWGEKKWAPREKAVRDSGILYHCVGPHGASGFWMKSQECQVQEGDCGDYWSVAGAIIDIPAVRKNPRYSVHVRARGERPINVVKAIRTLNKNLSLKEAKEITDGNGKAVVAGAAREDADAAKKALEEQGASAEIVETGLLVYSPGAPKVTVGGGTRNGPYCKKDPDNEKPTGQWNVIEVMCVGGTSVHIVNGKVTMVLYNSRHKVDGAEVPLTKGRIQIQSEGAEVFYRNMQVRPLKQIPPELLK